MEALLEEVCDAATSGVDFDDLEIRGNEISTLARTFKAMLGDAAEAGDFTDVLSPNRSFVM